MRTPLPQHEPISESPAGASAFSEVAGPRSFLRLPNCDGSQKPGSPFISPSERVCVSETVIPSAVICRSGGTDHASNLQGGALAKVGRDRAKNDRPELLDMLEPTTILRPKRTSCFSSRQNSQNQPISSTRELSVVAVHLIVDISERVAASPHSERDFCDGYSERHLLESSDHR